jgi:hypothetical protein
MSMPSSRTRALNVGNYPSGQSELPSTALPDWANSLGIEIMRCTSADPTIWPNASTVVTLHVELSRDNGATWPTILFEGSVSGGIEIHNKTGLEVQSLRFDTPIPPELGVTRRVRGYMDIANGPCRTTMFISLDSESHVFLARR